MIKRSLLFPLLLAAGGLQAQDQAPDLDKAKQTVESVCIGCHGADGNSEAAANPKLAGQVETYIYKQLHDFKAHGEKKPARENAIMGAMVAGLEDADMKGLAKYFASQTQKPEAAKNDATINMGQKIWRAGIASKGVPACSSCHGPAGAGIPAQYPRLSGQFAEYTELQLKSFRDGVRANDPGRAMQIIALKMTDAEMKAVSDYAAGLR